MKTQRSINLARAIALARSGGTTRPAELEPIRGADPVTAYAQSVVSGKLLACRLVKLACERHLRDLVEGPNRGLRWRPDIASWTCEFFSQLSHSKGEWAGRRLELGAWQKFVVGSVYGWKREDGTRRFRRVYEEIPRKNGKALAVETVVPTPLGWKRHGDLEPGDLVFGEDGRPTPVLAVTPAYRGKCFRVGFSDGTSLVAHARHEWKTRRSWFTGKPHGKPGPLPLVETKTIAATLRQRGARPDFVHALPPASPIECRERALPVPPYTLGAWLGDGHSAGTRLTNPDPEVLDEIREAGTVVTATSVAITHTLGSGYGVFIRQLRALGVLNAKHIPALYLRASIAQRLELLRGLMDTDGYCSKAGQCELTLTNERLFRDAVELIRSLGLKVTTTEDRATLYGRDIGPRYRAQFFGFDDAPVFHLPRKRGRLKARPEKATRSTTRMVITCDPVGSRGVNCIEVAGGMYLAGDGFVPTHNSTKLAGVGIYMLTADREPGAEVYAAATKKEQARIIFDEAKRMVRSSPALHGLIKSFKLNMSVDETASKFEPLSADEKTLDGLNPSAVLIDEIHKHRSSAVVDVLDSALGSRRQPIMWMITTAGDDDPESVYAHENHYAQQVLDGIIEDDATFVYISTIDKGDAWDDPVAWAKANPNLEVSIKLSYLRDQAKKAKGLPSSLITFKRLHLNVRTADASKAIDAETWKANGLGLIDPALVKGRDCFCAVDLSSKLDISACVRLFPPLVRGDRWKILARFWVPADDLDEKAQRDRVPFQRWVEEGWIEATPGNVVDQDAILAQILADARETPPIDLAIDPWNAYGLIPKLQAEGLSVFEFVQGLKSYTAPTKELLSMLKAGAFDHGGNPVLAWMASNLHIQTDKNENQMPTKKHSRGRIDGMTALIMAVGRAINAGHTNIEQGFVML